MMFWKNNAQQCFPLHIDVDECLRPDICGEGRCINIVGTYRCEYCDSGYRMNRRGRCEGGSAGRTRGLSPLLCVLSMHACATQAGYLSCSGFPLPFCTTPVCPNLLHLPDSQTPCLIFLTLSRLFFYLVHSLVFTSLSAFPGIWSEITSEQLIAEYPRTNPDLIAMSGSFMWEHGAGVSAVDISFLTFSPCHIPVSPLHPFTCVLGLICRLPTV